LATVKNTVTIDGIEIDFPARPGVLARLSAVLETEDPNFHEVSELVNDDLGLAAEVVRSANSPYFGVSGRIASVQQAINFLGLSHVYSLVTGVMLRRVFPGNDQLMDELWDNSTRRAAIMARLARNTAVPVDRAYTVGLFQDCGVAVLAALMPSYRQTWKQTCWLPDATSVERRDHILDHPTISASLVEQWGLSDEIAKAVRRHHDIDRLDAPEISERTRNMVALSVIANFVLARALSQNASLWRTPFSQASAVLKLPLELAQTWAEQASSLL
jgi:HD-like signal output (HDOD) protein